MSDTPTTLPPPDPPEPPKPPEPVEQEGPESQADSPAKGGSMSDQRSKPQLADDERPGRVADEQGEEATQEAVDEPAAEDDRAPRFAGNELERAKTGIEPEGLEPPGLVPSSQTTLEPTPEVGEQFDAARTRFDEQRLSQPQEGQREGQPSPVTDTGASELPTGDAGGPPSGDPPFAGDDPRTSVLVSGDADGRAPLWEPQGQNYVESRGVQLLGTCGPAATAQLLTDYGKPTSENELVNYAVEQSPPLCNVNSGATSAGQRERLLGDHGMEATSSKGGTVDELARSVEDGHGVIVAVDAGTTQSHPGIVKPGESTNHAVWVTGTERDPETREVTGFRVNDSGIPDGAGMYVSRQAMEAGWERRGGKMTETNETRPMPPPRTIDREGGSR